MHETFILVETAARFRLQAVSGGRGKDEKRSGGRESELFHLGYCQKTTLARLRRQEAEANQEIIINVRIIH